MRFLCLAFFSCVVALASSQDAVYIRSEPAGARIEVNGQYLGTTPYIWKVGSFALNPRKNWIGSRRLESPLRMEITKEGYVSRDVFLTGPRLLWTSLNGQNHFEYYVITSTDFSIGLEKVGDFVGQNPFQQSSSESTTTLARPPLELQQTKTAQVVVQDAIPAVVQIRTASSLGSGFFVTSTGLIATNRHVVEGSQRVEVITSRGESMFSSAIYESGTMDLAIVKLEGGPFPYLPLAAPDSLTVGQDLIAIGSPRGLQNSVTKGLLSAFRKVENCALIQTDTSINPGDSGGPLLDMQGEVVGVNTFRREQGHDSGLNFAIHVGEVIDLMRHQFSVDPLRTRLARSDLANRSNGSLLNDDVLTLKNAGLSDDLIIQKIHSSSHSFSLAPSDIVSLHNAGLSDAVIAAMLMPSRGN